MRKVTQFKALQDSVVQRIPPSETFANCTDSTTQKGSTKYYKFDQFHSILDYSKASKGIGTGESSGHLTSFESFCEEPETC